MPILKCSADTLSIVIPAWNERPNLELLLPELTRVARALSIPAEIIVVDGGSTDGTAEAVQASGARFLPQKERGYGGALIAGFEACHSAYIVTMDADLSHPAEFLREFWLHRDDAEVLIASRYVPGGRTVMSVWRRMLSLILNHAFRFFFKLPFHDLSSGFRLYHREVLATVRPVARDFDALLEILITVYHRGHSIRELPFRYMPRASGHSHAKLLKFGRAYLATLTRLRAARPTPAAIDLPGAP